MATPGATSRLPALTGLGRDRTGRGSEKGRGTGGGAASCSCPQTSTLRGQAESEVSVPCPASHFLVAKATDTPRSENAATQTESAATPLPGDQSVLSSPSAGPPGRGGGGNGPGLVPEEAWTPSSWHQAPPPRLALNPRLAFITMRKRRPSWVLMMELSWTEGTF